MQKNMSSVDRIIRLIVAVVLLILILTDVLAGAWAVILGIVAAILIVTGLIGICPLYGVLKISTLNKK